MKSTSGTTLGTLRLWADSVPRCDVAILEGLSAEI